MNIKRPLLLAGVVSSIGLAGLTGNALVAAQTSTNQSDTIVTKLAEKFNLKSEDVQAVFDEERAAREAERRTEADKVLAQAVTDGKLTSEQKDKIIAKRTELEENRESKREAFQNMTDEQRRDEKDTKRAELDKWASDNGIPTEYQRYVMGGGHGHRGPGRMSQKAN
jgi:hypothetical protein